MNTKSFLCGSLLLCLFFSFTACKKKKEDLPPDYLKGMFIAGMELSGNKAYLRYWKDSVLQPIDVDEIEVDSEGDGYKVEVSGNAVYFLGSKKNQTTGIVEPCFWKNQTRTVLAFSPADLTVTGDDVYISGMRMLPGDNGYRACYSKNGTITDLTDGTLFDRAIAITVNGNDVHVAGIRFTGSNYLGMYWKNGTATTINDAKYIYDIQVSGNDVYMCGTNNNFKAAFWKNGVMTEFPGMSTGSAAKSILISGNDVHVAGYNYISGITYARYWKNGVNQTLPTQGSGESAAYSIAMDGTDVYITGFDKTASGKKAAYWKNGIESLLSPSINGAATAIKIIR